MRFNVYEDTAGGIWNCHSTNSWDEALKHAEKIDLKRTYIRDNKFKLTYNLATGMYPANP